MAEEGLEIAYFEEFPQEELIRFKGYDAAFRAYTDCLNINESFIPSLYEDIAKTRISTLKPAEINSLFEGTKLISKHRNFRTNTGLFFTALMQDSHNYRNNLFFLNQEYIKRKTDFIGYMLKGKETPLKLRVNGNAGHSFADESENVIAKADECGDWAGKFSRKTRIFVKNAGAYALWQASGSVLIADFIGIDAGKGAKNCEFRTKEQRTLEKLLESVPVGRGNKIILINENNSYKIVRNE
jgi:hypothetical protein